MSKRDRKTSEDRLMLDISKATGFTCSWPQPGTPEFVGGGAAIIWRIPGRGYVKQVFADVHGLREAIDAYLNGIRVVARQNLDEVPF